MRINEPSQPLSTQPVPERGQPGLLPARSIVFLRYLLSGVSLLTLLILFIQTVMRLKYPYDLNDNNMLDSVRQILSGHSLYVRPTIHFVPFLYTPIFFYAAAGMTKLTGVNLLSLRMVSIVSTLACFGMLYALVYAEARKHYAALAAVACFASCYPLVLQWFDIGRVDMLYLFFVLSALYATRWMNPAFAALLWICAFQTKQGVLPIALLALCHDWQRPRRALLGLATFAIGLGISIAWLTHATDGWYRYYVFGMSGGFGYNLWLAKHYIPSDLFATYGIAMLIATAAVLLDPPDWRDRAARFYIAGSIGMVVYTGFIRAHRGAASNAVLPAYVWIALLFGISLARLSRSLLKRHERPAQVALVLLYTAASVQIIMHMYSPREYVPNQDQIAQHDAFEEDIRSIPGEVLVFAHPEYGITAGKSMYAEFNAAGSVIDAKNHTEGDRLISDYAQLIHSGTLSAIVLDRDPEWMESLSRSWIPKDFLSYYPLHIRARGSDEVTFSDSPRWIYFPCTSAGAAKRLDPHLDVSSICK